MNTSCASLLIGMSMSLTCGRAPTAYQRDIFSAHPTLHTVLRAFTNAGCSKQSGIFELFQFAKRMRLGWWSAAPDVRRW
jgi:hypothetical protein